MLIPSTHIIAELVSLPWLPWALLSLALAVCLAVLFARVNALAAALEELKQRQLTPPPTPPLPPAPIPATPAPVPAASPPPPQVLTTSPTDPNALPDGHLIAIITAAAIAALGKQVVVRRLTFLDQNTVSGWAEAGRLMIQTSHNMIRKG